jgi:hypothetical protein
MVTIKGAGTATITATVTDGDNYTYSGMNGYNNTTHQASVSYTLTVKPATMEISTDSIFTNGVAMAHMVLANHNKAQIIQIISKAVVACDTFGNSMNQLNHSFGRLLRSPFAVMDFTCSAGRIIMICTHSNHSIT